MNRNRPPLFARRRPQAAPDGYTLLVSSIGMRVISSQIYKKLNYHPVRDGGEKRSPLTPELPTIVESGVPGYVSTGWAGLMAPKRAPRPILDKVHATMAKALSDSPTRELMERQGGEPLTSTPEEMLRVINEDYVRMGAAIKLARLKVE